MVPRDRLGLSIHADDVVIVQVGNGTPTLGKIVSTVPGNKALDGLALVRFDNGTTQWMDGKHLEVKTYGL